jgi:hypothetical protein
MEGLTRLYRYSPGRLLGAIGADRILDSAGVRIRLGKNICPKMQVVAHSGASKKAAQLREKSRGQLQHTETRIGSNDGNVARGGRALIRRQELRHHSRDFWLARFIPAFSNRSRKKRCIARVTPEIPDQF